MQVNANGIFYGDQNFYLPSHRNYGKFFLDKILGHKDNIALINGATEEKITFREMAQQIVNTASSLALLGVKCGDVVAICSENRIEFLISAIAVFCSGATVTFINSAYSKAELIHTLKISRPKYIFLSSKTQESYFETINKLNIVEQYFFYENTSVNGKIIYFKDLVARHVDIASFKPYDFNGQVQTALILYSSGTTGLPKGAKLTHLNLIISGNQSLPYKLGRVCMIVAPWPNTVGIICTLKELLNGDTVVFLAKFDEAVYLQAIEKFKIGTLLAVPPLVVLLCKSSIIKNYNVNSVEIIYCGGAPLYNSVINEAKTKFPNLKGVIQGYGATETSGAVTEENEMKPRQGSVGIISAGNIIKVVDVETRKILGPNIPGEVCVKGPVLFEGYIGRDLKDDCDEDGFYKTGDVAYYDKDGYFYIVDRIKELIKYKAGQVTPSELEALLLQHSAIKDAGVVGAPDPLVGELPTAFVVKKPGSNVTEKELIDYVAAKVSSWKQLRGGVIFVNEIPKTASGKILRRILRDSLSKLPTSKL